MPAEWEKPMPLNTLLERGRTVAEYGRALAERVPYRLVAGIAVRGRKRLFALRQTKVHGFHA